MLQYCRETTGHGLEGGEGIGRFLHHVDDESRGGMQSRLPIRLALICSSRIDDIVRKFHRFGLIDVVNGEVMAGNRLDL